MAVPMLLQSEVPLGDIRWIRLDPMRAVTMGLQPDPSMKSGCPKSI
ncbi:MAG: hypothetical protein ABJA98_02425 [Acidobacteriota bacterium]